jgi:hypothetical protein
MIALNLMFLLIHHVLPSTSQSRPCWARLVLMLDCAIEFPFIYAFHPTILIHGVHQGPNLPSDWQLLLQVAVFFAVEVAFQNCVLNFVRITPETPKMHNKTTFIAEYSESTRCEDAESYVLAFLRPRGTLLLSIGLLGTPTALTKYTGYLHPMAMLLWAVLEQRG